MDFARGLAPTGKREAVNALYEAMEAGASPWPGIGVALGQEIDGFDRSNFAAAYAFIHGGDVMAVHRRQHFLVRTAVTSVLFPLEAFEDRLLRLIETRGIPSLFQNVVRELADEGADTQLLFEASGACRMAAFALEDMLRASEKGPHTVEGLVQARNHILDELWERVQPEGIPFGWASIALLWVTANIGLGDMNDTHTTEHFVDD